MKNTNIISRGRPTEWTLEKSTEFAADILKYIKETEDCYTLGEACVECGHYEDVISYIKKFHKCEFEDILLAKDIIKNRVIKLAMQNKVNTTMSIFNLVNNHDMINTNTKSDITSKGQAVNSVPLIEWTQDTEHEDLTNQKSLNDGKETEAKND